MNLIQMMNPTNDSIGAAIRPQYEKDVRLRSALRMTAVSMEEQSHMIAGGRLVEVAESTGPHLFLLPDEPYNLALLESVPMDLSNEYQDKRYQVDFMLELSGIS